MEESIWLINIMRVLEEGFGQIKIFKLLSDLDSITFNLNIITVQYNFIRASVCSTSNSYYSPTFGTQSH